LPTKTIVFLIVFAVKRQLGRQFRLPMVQRSAGGDTAPLFRISRLAADTKRISSFRFTHYSASGSAKVKKM
jgi:hypothetical protein